MAVRLEEPCADKKEESIAIHILSVSAAMVGVCMTAIGIINVITSVRSTQTIADDLLADDAILFLVSCALSYFALRSSGRSSRHRLERIADIVFLVALTVMVAVCIFVVYDHV